MWYRLRTLKHMKMVKGVSWGCRYNKSMTWLNKTDFELWNINFDLIWQTVHVSDSVPENAEEPAHVEVYKEKNTEEEGGLLSVVTGVKSGKSIVVGAPAVVKRFKILRSGHQVSN